MLHHVGTVHPPDPVQVASAESCEALAVQPGRWYDVPGLTQISYTDNGEKAASTGPRRQIKGGWGNGCNMLMDGHWPRGQW